MCGGHKRAYKQLRFEDGRMSPYVISNRYGCKITPISLAFVDLLISLSQTKKIVSGGSGRWQPLKTSKPVLTLFIFSILAVIQELMSSTQASIKTLAISDELGDDSKLRYTCLLSAYRTNLPWWCGDVDW